MVGVRGRVALTVMVVAACLYSLLAAMGFLRIANGGRDAIRERIEAVLDQLEGHLLAGDGTARLSTPDGVIATAGSPDQAPAERAGEIVTVRLVTVSGRSLALVGRASEARLADSLQSLHRGVWIGVPVAVLVTTGAAWLAVGRALRPVSRITSLAAGIGATDLAQRVPVPDTGDEVAELAATVNAMLGRIEAGRLAQRRFTSDAAHELRTPLMALQGEIELARRDPLAAGDPLLLARLDRQCARLAARVDDLVLLSTLDEHPPLRVASTDVVALVRDEAGTDLPIDAGLAVVECECDAQLVRRAVANLLANARRHAAERVEATITTADGPVPRIWIHVDDDGPGIPPGERERVLTRFGRLDDARDADSGGSGLGLAIVASVATAHGGGVTVADSPLGGARVSFWLPGRGPSVE